MANVGRVRDGCFTQEFLSSTNDISHVLELYEKTRTIKMSVTISFARRIFAGTAAITLAGIGSRLLSFVTVPILTPLLGPEPYGIVALVGSAVSIGGILGLLGIDMAYARYFLAGSHEQSRDVERFCWRFTAVASLCSSLAIAFLWLGWGSRWAVRANWIWIYCVIAICLSTTVTMATTRIRLQSRYGRVALAQLGAAVTSALVSIAIALFWRADAWALLLGMIAASLASLAILGVPPAGTWFEPARLSSDMRRKVVGLGLAGSVTAPMHWLITSSDRWFISAWRDTSEAGVYSVAVSIGMIGGMLNSSFVLTWFPEISRLYSAHGPNALLNIGRLWGRVVAVLAVVWVAVAGSGGDILRLLAAPKFHEGALFIPWIAGGVFFYGLASMCNTSLFLEEKMRYAAFTWVVGGFASLLLNLTLVPALGAFGAALTQCLTFMVIAVLTFLIAQRRMPLPIELHRILPIAGLSLLVGGLMANPWSSSPLLSLLYKLPISIVYAAVIFRVAAPDWFEKLRRKATRLLFGVV